jgi:hypothetical protein
MSSSSDIEKLFDHFGGDANAYQEIGRENEARSARTRWPLLVTLDLTQPAIPAIGQHREPKPHAPVNAAASLAGREDSTPKDVAAVTRAKAPLFTRSHRRDIPPVVAAAPQPAAPSGASRFGALEAENDGAAPNASAGGKVDAAAQYVPAASVAPVAAAAPFAPVAPVASSPVAPIATAAPLAPVVPVAPVAPAASIASIAPVAAFAPFAPATSVASATFVPIGTPARLAPVAAVPPAASVPSATPGASAPPAFLLRTPATQTPPPAQPAAPTWTQASAPTFAPAPTPARAYAHAYTPAIPATAAPAQRAQPTQPTSILGKLFPPAPQSAPPQPAAHANESAPLQSVFDRLRGAPAPTSATPASASSAAASGISNSWLFNGPRRS